MAPLHLDATTTERLITGALEIDDAPPGFDRVAALINKAQGPATAGELAARVATVTAFAAKVRARPVVRARTKGTFAFPKFPAKVLALAAPVVLLGGGVAAATGSLPPSAQAAVSRALSSLGISVPNPQNANPQNANSENANSENDDYGIAGTPPSSTGSATAKGTGPDAGTGSPATVGLCRAWKAGGLNRHGTAYRSLTAAAGGAGNLATYCGGVPTSSAPGGATGHAEKPSSGQLDGGHGATTPSTTGGRRGVAHRAGSIPDAIAKPRSSAIAPGRSVATTPTTPPAAPGRHRPNATGTSRLPVGTSRRSPTTAGLLVPRGTHKATTATARPRGHRPSTKAGQWEPPASKSPTPGKSATTPPVWASPVSSSIPAGPGPSEHHGQTGPPRRQRGCTHSARAGHVIQARHCHRVMPTGSKSNATSRGSRRHDARPPRRVPSVGSEPRSVKHRNSR